MRVTFGIVHSDRNMVQALDQSNGHMVEVPARLLGMSIDAVAHVCFHPRLGRVALSVTRARTLSATRRY